MKHLVLLVALLAAPWLRPAHAADVPPRPKPFTFVTDQANLIEPADEKRLDYGLRQYADNTGTQVVIVTVPSLGGQDVNAYARELGTSWGIGQQGKDNGLVVLVSQQDHKLSIEPGSGLRSRVTAGVIQQAIGQMTPQFKQNNYGQGLRNGLNILLKAANPNSAPASAPAAASAAAASTDATPPTSSQAMSDPATPSAAPVEAPSPGLPWGTILLGAVVVIGGFLLLKRLFGGNRNSADTAGGNSPGFYPNRPNAPQPNQPQGGQPNFYPNQGQPGYGAPMQQGGSGSGMGGILATGAAAAAGAYLGNRLGGDHDSNDSGRSFNNTNDNAGNEAGLGAGAAGGAAAAGDDYFSSRDNGGGSAPDYFSNSGDDSGSGDYFSGNDNSYDDSSGGGGFDDTSDNSGSW